MEEQDQLNSLTTEVTELQEEIDQALEEAASKKFKRYKEYMKDGTASGNTSF